MKRLLQIVLATKKKKRMAKLRLTIDYPSDITRDRRVYIFRIRRMIEFIVEFIAVPEVHSSAW